MTITAITQNWQSTLIPLGSTIRQAIHSLEQSALQVVLVITADNRLVGTLTDGDIRRAFLKGHQMDSNIDQIVQTNPLAVPADMGREMVLQLMKINKIHQLPVVDHNNSVIGLHVWNSVLEPAIRDNCMVIMAGGKGTRLRPHTENCPKPMLEVSGKPMLEHIMDRAKEDGFRNFVISLNYLGHMIEDHFGNGERHGINIQYLREDSPLGTAGCLGLFEDIPKLPFVVTNGDVLTDIHYSDLLDFHVRHHADATMAVRQHEIQNQFGVVMTQGLEIEGFEEKPIYRSHINAGVYILNPESLIHINRNQKCDMPTLLEMIKESGGRTIVYPMHEPWLDVGRPDDLAIANNLTKNIS